MNKPNMWFKRTHLATGLVFEVRLTCSNCPLWDETWFGGLNIRAQNRIDELNTKMPDTWRYELIGWRIEE